MNRIKLGQIDRKSEQQLEKMIMNILKQVHTMEQSLERQCQRQAENYIADFMKQLK